LVLLPEHGCKMRLASQMPLSTGSWHFTHLQNT
jgi:hypothetical protein